MMILSKINLSEIQDLKCKYVHIQYFVLQLINCSDSILCMIFCATTQYLSIYLCFAFLNVVILVFATKEVNVILSQVYIYVTNISNV